MFNFSFQVGHTQSGAEYAVNLADLPVVAPLLESIFDQLRQLPISAIPDQIPAIFYAQKPGFESGRRAFLPPGTHSKNVQAVAPPGLILPEDQAVPSHVLIVHEDHADVAPAQFLQDDIFPPAPLQEEPEKGKVFCKVCKVPQSKPNLARHMRVFHSDDPRPFKCDPPCKYSAPRRDQLTQHQAPTGGCGRNKGSTCTDWRACSWLNGETQQSKLVQGQVSLPSLQFQVCLWEAAQTSHP